MTGTHLSSKGYRSKKRLLTRSDAFDTDLYFPQMVGEYPGFEATLL